jgi:hypothetical protein
VAWLALDNSIHRVECPRKAHCQSFLNLSITVQSFYLFYFKPELERGRKAMKLVESSTQGVRVHADEDFLQHFIRFYRLVELVRELDDVLLTPLHAAMVADNESSVTKLLEQGSDIGAVIAPGSVNNGYGVKVIEWAAVVFDFEVESCRIEKVVDVVTAWRRTLKPLIEALGEELPRLKAGCEQPGTLAVQVEYMLRGTGFIFSEVPGIHESRAPSMVLEDPEWLFADWQKWHVGRSNMHSCDQCDTCLASQLLRGTDFVDREERRFRTFHIIHLVYATTDHFNRSLDIEKQLAPIFEGNCSSFGLTIFPASSVTPGVVGSIFVPDGFECSTEQEERELCRKLAGVVGKGSTEFVCNVSSFKSKHSWVERPEAARVYLDSLKCELIVDKAGYVRTGCNDWGTAPELKGADKRARVIVKSKSLYYEFPGSSLQAHLISCI